MYDKRQKALSSYSNVNIYKSLTLDELTKAFPNKLKRISSPKTQAIQQRRKLYDMIKKETRYLQDVQILNAAKPTRKLTSDYETPYNRTKRLERLIGNTIAIQNYDTIKQSIEKARMNIIGRETYARSLKKALKNNNIGLVQEPNVIKNTIFIQEPNPELIDQLVIQENVKENIENHMKFTREQSHQHLGTHSSRPSANKYDKGVSKIHNDYLDVDKYLRTRSNNNKNDNKKNSQVERQRIAEAIRQLKQQEPKIEEHLKKCLQTWEAFTPDYQLETNRQRAQILYENRWNKTLKKILIKYDLENHQKKFLQNYFNPLEDKLIIKIIKDNEKIEDKTQEIKYKVEQSMRSIKQMPVLELNSPYKHIVKTLL